jgi:predicted GNAT family N-acyltransferase
MPTAKWFPGTADLTDAYRVRRAVFVVEQQISEEIEYDGTDADAEHLVVYENGRPIATGRLILIDGKMHIGRLAVLMEYRGKGLGIYTMEALISRAAQQGYSKLYIHAQSHTLKFYEKVGFKAYGDEYMEAGIPHYSMYREDNQ